MTIYKIDGKLIKSGAKFNTFIKAASIKKFGHVLALEILKRVVVEATARKAALKANPNSKPAILKTKPEMRTIIELEIGGETVEVF